jgi:hypothetical protein
MITNNFSVVIIINHTPKLLRIKVNQLVKPTTIVSKTKLMEYYLWLFTLGSNLMKNILHPVIQTTIL